MDVQVGDIWIKNTICREDFVERHNEVLSVSSNEVCIRTIRTGYTRNISKDWFLEIFTFFSHNVKTQ